MNDEGTSAMMSSKGAALAVAAITLALSNTASAQSAVSGNTRPNAFSFNVGPAIDLETGGATARINPEFQVHFGGRYEGPAFNIGLDILPQFRGVVLAVAPRFQYDVQLLPGTAFFLSPYGGMDIGLRTSSGGSAFVMAPVVGLDLKVIVVNRLLLGFRPIGIMVPLTFAGGGVGASIGYDIAFSIGVTF
jgi:hypothetical protein